MKYWKNLTSSSIIQEIRYETLHGQFFVIDVMHPRAFTSPLLSLFLLVDEQTGVDPVVPWLSDSPLDPRFAGSNPAGVEAFFFRA